MSESTLRDEIRIPISVAGQDSIVHKNIGQEYIVTTVDKVEICLTKHKNSLQDKHKWLIPCSALLSTVLVIATSEFQTRFGIDADYWQGTFVTAAIFLFGWTVYWIVMAVQAPDLDNIVAELKKPNRTIEAGDNDGPATTEGSID